MWACFLACNDRPQSICLFRLDVYLMQKMHFGFEECLHLSRSFVFFLSNHWSSLRNSKAAALKMCQCVCCSWHHLKLIALYDWISYNASFLSWRAKATVAVRLHNKRVVHMYGRLNQRDGGAHCVCFMPDRLWCVSERDNWSRCFCSFTKAEHWGVCDSSPCSPVETRLPSHLQRGSRGGYFRLVSIRTVYCMPYSSVC